MKKISLELNGTDVQVDQAFLDGLEYMGTLNDLYGPNRNQNVPEGFREPLYFLFEYSRKRMKQAGRDRNLPNALRAIKGLEKFADYTSNTDEKHTIAVFDYVARIATGNINVIEPQPIQPYGLSLSHKFSFSGTNGYHEYDKKALLSAAICHDCTYPLTTGIGYKDKDIKQFHQVNGALEFKNFAKQINEIFDSFGFHYIAIDKKSQTRKRVNLDKYPFYEPRDIDRTAHIIEKHDSPPFDPNNPEIELLLSHREGDRLWMLDRAGFALDILRGFIESKGKVYKPLDMLAHNVSRHIQEAREYQKQSHTSVVDCQKKFNSYNTLYVTQKGFDIFSSSLEQRMYEYGISEDDFNRKLKERLENGKKKN